MAKTIEQRLAEIADRKAKLASREAKLISQKRKDDARQKIVVGSALIAEAIDNKVFAKTMSDILARRVTRDHDKAVIAPLMELLGKIVATHRD